MSRKAVKRLQLMRVAYTRKNQNLQTALQNALNTLPTVAATEVQSSEHGVIRVNNFRAQPQGHWLQLQLVSCAPGEAATTVGLRPQGRSDREVPAPPPAQRVYKNGDFFAHVVDNHIVCCTDGIRATAAEKYVRALLGKANLIPATQAFEWKHVSNVEQLKLLDAEGVKEIDLRASLFAATLDRKETDAESSKAIRGAAKRLKRWLVGLVSKDMQPQLLEQLSAMQVDVSLRPTGKARGEKVIVDAMRVAGAQVIEADEDAADGVSFEIVTKKGNRISHQGMTVGHTTTFTRRNGENSLSAIEVWDALGAFADQLEADEVYEL